MKPLISIELIRELDEVVASAAARSETINLQRTAQKIHVRNVGTVVALEDVMEQLLWRAARMGVTMEFSSEDGVATPLPQEAMPN